MARIKYYYDTETCRYERVKTSKTDVVVNMLGFLSTTLVLASGLVIGYVNYFPSDQEQVLKKENDELLLKYQVVNKELAEVGNMISVLQERDDNIYRVIFEAAPLPSEIRKGGTGGTEKYKDLLAEKLTREDLILGTLQKIDQIKKQMYIQTKSYDDLVALSKKKSEMVSSIPAIQPISNKDLRRFASGFGYRTHPILKVSRMHSGCDFAAPTGTPVFSTGDGKVITAERSSGYGNEIEVDHGYGYVTKYAHLSAFGVRVGQKVKRGQEIGKVGNTGLSVAPHLHYEVLHNGNKVNPVNYFFNDLSPQEYDKMLEMADTENQSLGGGE